MLGYHQKQVRFDLYCETCEHKDEPETVDPCNECLETPAREFTNKPINYIEKENKK